MKAGPTAAGMTGDGSCVILAFVLRGGVLFFVHGRVSARAERVFAAVTTFVVLGIASVQLFARVASKDPFPMRFLSGTRLAGAVAGSVALLLLGGWRALRDAAIARVETGALAGWHVEDATGGKAIVGTRGPAYREGRWVVAIVPDARDRRRGIARALALGVALGVLALILARLEYPRAWEVTSLRANAAHITGLTLLGNRETGTDDHVCAVFSDGHARCVGYFDDGFEGPVWEAPETPIVQIAGAYYTRSTSGVVRRSGLGPSELTKLQGEVVDRMAAYLTFGLCAVLHGGQVFCVAPDNPELGCVGGIGAPIGGYVPDLDDAIDLASAGRVMCALRRGGDLRCWSSCSVDDPVALAPISNVAEVTGGRDFCTRQRDGSVRCLSHDRWTRVDGVAADRLYGGLWATCARTRAGDLWCWKGLGDGDSFELRRVPTPEGFELGAVGDAHVCFVHEDRIRCIGRR
jgi:hypothetical protein